MKSLPFFACLIALVIGFGSGAGFQRWQQRSVSDLLRRIPVTHAAANATRCVSVLRLLRAGETERAANMLETYLDGDLVALGQAYQTTTPKQRVAAWAPQAIRIAREYREAHPHAPNASIAGAVQETLSIPTP